MGGMWDKRQNRGVLMSNQCKAQTQHLLRYKSKRIIYRLNFRQRESKASTHTMTEEKIDIHAHFIPPFYQEACLKTGHGKPDGMPTIPVRMLH